MMEPIRLWRDEATSCDVERWRTYKVDDYQQEYAALPRADFDALVKRDSTCPLCGDDLDPDEADYDSDIPPAGAGVCSRCFCRWHDAPVYEKRAKEATARADALAALLKEARGYVTYGIGEGDPHGIGAAMLARIDAALEEKK